MGGIRAGLLMQPALARDAMVSLVESLGWIAAPVLADADALLKAQPHPSPNLVLIHLDLLRLRAGRDIRDLAAALPEVPLLGFSHLPSTYLSELTADLGLAGYVSTRRATSELLTLVERCLEPLVESRPRPSRRRHKRAELPSPREWDVLNCIALGLDNAQTSARLGVSLQTVKSHVRALYRKLAVETRVGLIREADARFG